MRDTSRNKLNETKSAQGMSRRDTFQRLAREVNSGVDRSDYGYGAVKRVDPITGVDSLQSYHPRHAPDWRQPLAQKVRSGDRGGSSSTEELERDHVIELENSMNDLIYQDHHLTEETILNVIKDLTDKEKKFCKAYLEDMYAQGPQIDEVDEEFHEGNPGLLEARPFDEEIVYTQKKTC